MFAGYYFNCIKYPSDDIVLLMITIKPERYSYYQKYSNIDYSLLAVNLYPPNIQFTEHTDNNLYMAIMSNPFTIKYIENPSEYLCSLAVKLDINTLKYISNPSEKLCLYALSINSKVICYIDIKKQTYVICKYAMEKNIENFQYCNPAIICNHKDLLNMVKESNYYKNLKLKED